MGLIASFTFGYGTEIDAALEARLVPILGKPIERDETGKVQTWQDYQADVTRLLPVLANAAQIVVSGLGAPQPLAEISNALGRIEAQLGRPGDSGSYVNNRMDVHVPGNALLSLDEVQLLSDSCTDYLQEQLNTGWRIVAVCPQPDQRRPDYILGRRKPLDE